MEDVFNCGGGRYGRSLATALVGNGYVDMAGLGQWNHALPAGEKGRNNPVITDVGTYLHIRPEAYFERGFHTESQKGTVWRSQRPESTAGYAIHFYDGKTVIPEPVTGDRVLYYVTKGYSICRQHRIP